LIPIKGRAGAKARFEKPTEMKLALKAAVLGNFANGQGSEEQHSLAAL
jgi:hypothetical protein